jgi:hypothetical protein
LSPGASARTHPLPSPSAGLGVEDVKVTGQLVVTELPPSDKFQIDSLRIGGPPLPVTRGGHERPRAMTFRAEFDLPLEESFRFI